MALDCVEGGMGGLVNFTPGAIIGTEPTVTDLLRRTDPFLGIAI